MKVLFIMPDIIGDKGKPTAPPPGISYLAAMLLKHNHEVKAIDMRINKNIEYLLEQTKLFTPDFIGISFMSMEYLKSYNLIEIIKNAYPKIKLIIGGPHISTFEGKVLEDTKADLAIIGEGEYALLEVCNGKTYSEIKGLIWRDNNQIIKNEKRQFLDNIDELPFPAYEIFPLEEYVDKKIPIVTSRGCPYQCIYCAMKKVMGSKWRFRSPENVFAEIEHWYKQGYTYFHFVDDNFTLDMTRAEKICDLIIKNNLKIKWDLRNGVRVDRLNEQLLLKMKRAGCFYLALGIESLDNEVLNNMKKGTTREKALEAIQLVKKVGIPFGGFFMIGLPGDTYKKFLDEYELVKSLNLEEVRFYNVIPFPYTELYEEIKNKGKFLKSEKDYLNFSSKMISDPLYELEGFTKEEKIKALDMGKDIVMEKLIKKEFGTSLGSIGYNLWKIKFLRNIIYKPGVNLWGFIRKNKRNNF